MYSKNINSLSEKDVFSYFFSSFDPQMMTSLESGGLKLNQQVLWAKIRLTYNGNIFVTY